MAWNFADITGTPSMWNSLQYFFYSWLLLSLSFYLSNCCIRVLVSVVVFDMMCECVSVVVCDRKKRVWQSRHSKVDKSLYKCWILNPIVLCCFGFMCRILMGNRRFVWSACVVFCVCVCVCVCVSEYEKKEEKQSEKEKIWQRFWVFWIVRFWWWTMSC